MWQPKRRNMWHIFASPCYRNMHLCSIFCVIYICVCAMINLRRIFIPFRYALWLFLFLLFWSIKLYQLVSLYQSIIIIIIICDNVEISLFYQMVCVHSIFLYYVGFCWAVLATMLWTVLHALWLLLRALNMKPRVESLVWSTILEILLPCCIC